VVREVFQRVLMGLFVLGLACAGSLTSLAQSPQNSNGGPQNGAQHGRHPVYQRRGSDWGSKGFDHRRQGQRFMPQMSSGWFQRPYPYHLDYYKMRYGGSYAPYFGNLYGTPFGTPQVVNGSWGPDAGGLGPRPPQGYEWMDDGAYGCPPGNYVEQPAQTPAVNQADSQQTKSENLPAPSK
jgi:hypothetical protein